MPLNLTDADVKAVADVSNSLQADAKGQIKKQGNFFFNLVILST
jgi:hypothetical protein